MLPRILKNYNAYVNGISFAGRIDEIELPEISIKMEEMRSGGMDGSVEIDMGQDVMTSKLTIKDPDAGILKLVGVANTRVLFRGSFVRDHDNTRIAVAVELGGKIKKITYGSWKAGETNSTEYEYTADYYKLTVAGEELHEIDVINMIRMIGGTDQLAGIRSDIGL